MFGIDKRLLWWLLPVLLILFFTNKAVNYFTYEKNKQLATKLCGQDGVKSVSVEEINCHTGIVSEK